MAQLRGKGIQCFGIGPATDFEDGPKGFGAHSDQERLLESELHRFVRFNWEVVTSLARARCASLIFQIGGELPNAAATWSASGVFIAVAARS
jgi:hypothetical protein